MNTRPIIGRLLALGACSLLLGACVQEAPKESGGGSADRLTGEIKIGVPLSLTGVAGFVGTSSKEGMEYAIDQVNDSGMLGDATLVAEYVDVAADPNQAVAAVRGFGGDSSIAAIVGNTMSNHALAIAPVAQQAGVPFVAVNTGGDSKLTSVGDHVYQVDVRQSTYAQKMGEELAHRGVTSVAVVVNNDVPAIAELWGAYREDVLPDSDIEVATVQELPSTATDFSAVVTSVLAAHADSVALLTRAGAVQMVTQLRQAGYDGVIWSQAALGGGAAVAAAPATEGVLYTVNAAAGSDIASMNEFFEGYRTTYGKDGYAFAAQGNDAVWAVAHAIKDAGCGTRECIQKGLQELMGTGFEGALGDLTFTDRNAVGPGAIVTIRDGAESYVR
jgi:branched-chain amino acid transport system substrate-binding protein